MAREKAWGVAIARQLASELPAAAAELHDVKLSERQVHALRVALEKRLIESMGEDSDETPASVAKRAANKG